MIDDIKNYIENNTKSKVLTNEPMKNHTTYGIGGPADLFVFPSNKEDLIKVFEISKEHSQKINIVGSGSNLLVSDHGIRGVIICIKNCLNSLKVEDNKIYAECGVMLGKLVKNSIKNNLKGLENLIGVPGTLGGALIMNAGAWGGEISNCLESVELIDPDKNAVAILSKSEIDFSYRSSKIAQLGRKDTQPLKYRSAGSVFKNPSKEKSAGMLIDKAGLKGLTIGDAQISEKHANFFINKGNAKASDMLMLIKKAKNKVKDKFNVDMDLEVKLMGFEKREIDSL